MSWKCALLSVVFLATTLPVIRAEAQQDLPQNPVAPVYPLAAKAAGIEGTVKLKGTIGTDGKMRNVSAVSGPDQLRQAAVDAVSQWTYQPYRHFGNLVEVKTTVKVVFTLGDKNRKAVVEEAAQAELAKQQSIAETKPVPAKNE